jgi:hypothetical protein
MTIATVDSYRRRCGVGFFDLEIYPMKNVSKDLKKIEKLAGRVSLALWEDMNRIICTHDSDFPDIELRYQQLSIHREATLSPAMEKANRLADTAASIRHSYEALRTSTPIFHEMQQHCNFYDDEPPTCASKDEPQPPLSPFSGLNVPFRP